VFRLEKFIGYGFFGEVFEAIKMTEGKEDGIPCVLKRVPQMGKLYELKYAILSRFRFI
jgi:hypothetical protein